METEKHFDIRKFNEFQCHEMEKHIWCESVRLGYNIAPTQEEKCKILSEWIRNHAKELRSWAKDQTEFYS